MKLILSFALFCIAFCLNSNAQAVFYSLQALGDRYIYNSEYFFERYYTVPIYQRKAWMINYIDLFAGIGGIRRGVVNALANHGIESRCVLSSEIDEKICRKTTRVRRYARHSIF